MNVGKIRGRFLVSCITAVLLGQMICSGAVFAEKRDVSNIEEILENMTVQEKVAQLFFITPEQLTGYKCVTQVGEVTKKAYEQYPVGGLIYFTNNLETEEQTKTMLAAMKKISLESIGVPVFLGIDEEGGRVAHLYESGIGDVPKISAMLELGESGDADEMYKTGKMIGTYLCEYGFNLNFAPVADIFSNPENEVIGNRALGKDALTVSKAIP